MLKITKPPFNWIIGSILLILISFLLTPIARKIADYYMVKTNSKIEHAKKLVEMDAKIASKVDNVRRIG